MLCQKCSEIHFIPVEQSVTDRPKQLVNYQPTLGYTTLYYLHHDGLQALQRSANEGCHLCFMIANGIPHVRRFLIRHSRDVEDREIVFWRLCNNEELTKEAFKGWHQRGFIEIELLGHSFSTKEFHKCESKYIS